MLTEDLSVFFADFAVDATLNGSSVRAIVDTSSLVELDGVLTQEPSAQLTTASSVAAAPGQSFVASAVTYTVRRVLREPPDGVLTRLVLARA
jgi:hypothetical protein